MARKAGERIEASSKSRRDQEVVGTAHNERRENGSVPPTTAKRALYGRLKAEAREKTYFPEKYKKTNRSRYERGLLAILRVVRIEASPIHDGMAGFGHCCWESNPAGHLRKTYGGFRHN